MAILILKCYLISDAPHNGKNVYNIENITLNLNKCLSIKLVYLHIAFMFYIA